MNKLLLLIISGFLLAGCAVFSPSSPNVDNLDQDVQDEQILSPAGVKKVVEQTTEIATEVVSAVLPSDQPTDLPATFDQEMAFARQAPFGQWENAFYQDGCEEASLIMASKFFAGQPLDEAIMKEELDKVEPWELDRLGQSLSVDTESVAIMAREYYGLSAQVSDQVTIEKIKEELLKGNLIILPLLGQEINNPNFTGAGPLYHMLVVRGYDRNEFITNDPGTRLGAGYKYPYDVLIKATKDWQGGDIYNGQRLMLIVGQDK